MGWADIQSKRSKQTKVNYTHLKWVCQDGGHRWRWTLRLKLQNVIFYNVENLRVGYLSIFKRWGIVDVYILRIYIRERFGN